MKASRLMCLVLVLATLFSAPLRARTTSDPANLSQRDGSHDFDFLIGDGKAHVRRLPDRLNNSSSIRIRLENSKSLRFAERRLIRVSQKHLI